MKSDPYTLSIYNCIIVWTSLRKFTTHCVVGGDVVVVVVVVLVNKSLYYEKVKNLDTSQSQ